VLPNAVQPDELLVFSGSRLTFPLQTRRSFYGGDSTSPAVSEREH